MKRLFLFITLTASTLCFAQNEKEVSSTIESVNVFLQKAEVTRSAKASVQAGITDVVIEGLSQQIDPNSIQVTGKGEATIMSVTHRINHLNKAEKSPKVKALESELKMFEKSNVVVKYQKEALEQEKSMILMNKSIGGANSGVNWEQLEYIADFFRERLVLISEKWTILDEEEKANNEKIRDLRSQLYTLTSELNKPTSEVVVKLHTKAPQNVTLSCTYLVNQAGWIPLYDFRAEDGNEKVAVTMKANVFQNTGVDWKDIPLTLSTGNPSLGAVKPDLTTWRLYLREAGYKKLSRYSYYDSRNDDAEMAPMALGAASNRIVEVDKTTTGGEIDLAQVSSTTDMKQLSTEYSVSLAQTIPSDNKPHMVNIKDFDVTAAFQHAAVPKMDQDAFLLAHIPDWEAQDWISGEMNVFYDGTYVGKTFLDVAEVSDTMEISLGRDKKVAISREKIKDYCETKSIGFNRKKTVGYEIIVKNNKRTEININVQDQIPISGQEQIEVKANDISGAKLDEQTGFLTWDLKLKPGESKTLQIKFEVKYPRKYVIPNL